MNKYAMVFVIGSVGLCGCAGVKTPIPLRVEIDRFTFPSDVYAAMEVVANDVVEIIKKRMRGVPPLQQSEPALCYIPPAVWTTSADARPPITLTSDPLRIRIAIPEMITPPKGAGQSQYQHWARFGQFAYQLGHELTHVMLDPRRDNGVLESVATAMAFQVLDDMSIQWTNNPPSRQGVVGQVCLCDGRQFAPNFSRQRQAEIDAALQTFPPAIIEAVKKERWPEISLYLRYLTANQVGWSREVQVLAAIRMLAENIAWSDMVGLGQHTSPRPNLPSEFRETPIIVSEVPHLATLFCRVGVSCTTGFLVAEFNDQPMIDTGFTFKGDGRWIWLSEFSPDDRAAWKEKVETLGGKIIGFQ